MKVEFRPFNKKPYEGIETPLDELCVTDGNLSLHIECMDKDCYFVGIRLSDGREILAWIRREKGKLVMRAEDEGVVL